MTEGDAVNAVKVRVHGRVQGVYFRATAHAEAGRLGLVGWVRNMDDGTVAALFQGKAGAVDEMLRWCRVGPPGAQVAWIDSEDVEPDDALHGFSVR